MFLDAKLRECDDKVAISPCEGRWCCLGFGTAASWNFGIYIDKRNSSEDLKASRAAVASSRVSNDLR